MKRTDITAVFPEATDEQIKALMDIHGADLNAAKGNYNEIKGQLEAANATIAELQASTAVEDLAKMTEHAKSLQTELDTMKAAETVRTLREKVASETGVPVKLLTAQTEEECTAQAASILAFAKPGKYPTVPDGGEVTHTAQRSTRDLFAEWMNQQ